jgi:hypothetical protein
MRRTVVLFLAVVVGCGSSTAPAASLVGNYKLSAVDGLALPATVNVFGFTETYTSGTLSVADATYSYSLCIQSAGTSSSCGAGYDVLAGGGQWLTTSTGALDFIDHSDNLVRTATLSGGVLSVPYGANNVLTFGFTKQ